jgi:hypothetical protein
MMISPFENGFYLAGFISCFVSVLIIYTMIILAGQEIKADVSV